jgi:hypothetical protein
MQELKSMDIAKKAMDIIKKGAFLTVKAGEEMNTMTIGCMLSCKPYSNIFLEVI